MHFALNNKKLIIATHFGKYQLNDKTECYFVDKLEKVFKVILFKILNAITSCFFYGQTLYLLSYVIFF